MNEEEEFLPGGFAELLRQAQEMTQAAGEQAAAVEVEGQAGGGAVRIVVNGNLEFLAVHISPDVLEEPDAGLLEDLVLAALHDAVSRVRQAGPGGPWGGGGDFASLLGGGAMAGLGGLFGDDGLEEMMGALEPMLGGLFGALPSGAEEADPDPEGPGGAEEGSGPGPAGAEDDTE